MGHNANLQITDDLHIVKYGQALAAPDYEGIIILLHEPVWQQFYHFITNTFEYLSLEDEGIAYCDNNSRIWLHVTAQGSHTTSAEGRVAFIFNIIDDKLQQLDPTSTPSPSYHYEITTDNVGQSTIEAQQLKYQATRSDYRYSDKRKKNKNGRRRYLGRLSSLFSS